jgi:hypothetical protein
MKPCSTLSLVLSVLALHNFQFFGSHILCPSHHAADSERFRRSGLVNELDLVRDTEWVVSTIMWRAWRAKNDPVVMCRTMRSNLLNLFDRVVRVSSSF